MSISIPKKALIIKCLTQTHLSVGNDDHLDAALIHALHLFPLQQRYRIVDNDIAVSVDFGSLFLLIPVDNVPGCKDVWVRDELEGRLDFDEASRSKGFGREVR